LLISAGVSLIFPFFLWLFSSRERSTSKPELKQEGALPAEGRVNPQLFRTFHVLLGLLVLTLMLVPVCIAFRSHLLRGTGLLLSLIGVLSLAIVYAGRKGDLDWLKE